MYGIQYHYSIIAVYEDENDAKEMINKINLLDKLDKHAMENLIQKIRDKIDVIEISDEDNNYCDKATLKKIPVISGNEADNISSILNEAKNKSEKDKEKMKIVKDYLLYHMVDVEITNDGGVIDVLHVQKPRPMFVEDFENYNYQYGGGLEVMANNIMRKFEDHLSYKLNLILDKFYGRKIDYFMKEALREEIINYLNRQGYRNMNEYWQVFVKSYSE